MDINTHQPLHIAQIFFNSFHLFKKTWIHLWPLTIFLMLVIVSTNLFIYNREAPALFIGDFIFSVFVFSSVLYYTLHINEGEDIKLSKCLLVTVEKFLIIIVTTLVVMLLTIIAYGFLIIPGIIVSIWFCMSLPLILLEHAGLFNVLRKSYELTTDDWLRTAIVIFFPFIITSLVGFVITKFFLLFKWNLLYYKSIMIFFAGFFSIFYLPWAAALMTVQFKDLKNRQAFRALNPNPKPLSHLTESKRIL